MMDKYIKTYADDIERSIKHKWSLIQKERHCIIMTDDDIFVMEISNEQVAHHIINLHNTSILYKRRGL